MKLAYFQDPNGNFGDDLNPWLWDHLLPGVIDGVNDGRVMLGVGTILEPWFVKQFPPETRKIIAGSGGGMTVPAIVIDESWQVLCVRGPLTAAYLGLDSTLAASDPAVCIRDLWPRPDKPRGQVGFMPHLGSLRRYDWPSVCEQAGLEYINPHGDFLATLDQIANLRLILTEAMHGAIVADALRVPWFPLQISPINYVGKWHDWGASIRMPIHFKPLPDLYDPVHAKGAGPLLSEGPRAAFYELRQGTGRRARARASHLLRQYAENYEPYLSEDRDLDRAIDITRSRLGCLER